MVVPFEPEVEKAVRSKYPVLRLCGLSMISAVFLYGLLAWFLSSRELFSLPDETNRMLRVALILLAFVSVGILPLVNRFLTPSDPRCSSSDLLSGGLDRIYSRFLVRTLVSLGVAESLSLYGLVIALVMHSFQEFLSFAIPSAALMIFFFPRYDRWEAWVKNHVDPAGGRA